MSLEKDRTRIYFVEEMAILASQPIFDGTWDCFRLGVRPAGIPTDAQIIAVQYRMERRAFAFLVSHPSFDVVMPGAEVPHDSDGFSEVRFVTAVRQPDGNYKIELS